MGRQGCRTHQRFEGMGAIVTGGASGIGLGGRAADRRRRRAGRPLGRRPGELDAATAELGKLSRGRGSTSPIPAKSSARRRRPTRRWAISTCSSAAPGSPGENALVIDYPDRRMEAGLRHQRQRPLLLQPLRRAADEGARLRPHRQHRLDRRQGRATRRRPLTAPRKRRSSASPSRSARNSPRTASASTPSRRRRSRRRSSNRSRRRISPTCARRFRWSASARSRKRRR